MCKMLFTATKLHRITKLCRWPHLKQSIFQLFALFFFLVPSNFLLWFSLTIFIEAAVYSEREKQPLVDIPLRSWWRQGLKKIS